MKSVKYVPHYFNSSIAKVYGINAAIIFQYVKYRCERSPTHAVLLPLYELNSKYPYLGSWQISKTLEALTKADKKKPALLKRKWCGGTYSYSLNNAALYKPYPDLIDVRKRYDEESDEVKARKAHDKENEGKVGGGRRHFFDSILATKIGVVPAIIYSNIHFWIWKNWENKHDEVVRLLDPINFDDDILKLEVFAYNYTIPSAIHYCHVEHWALKHPYLTLRSAERGFKKLKDDGLLEVTHSKGRIPVWNLPKKETLKIMVIQLKKMELLPDETHSSAKTQKSPPEPKTQRQNLNASANTKNASANTQKETALNGEKSATCNVLNEALVGEALVEEALDDEAHFKEMTSSQPDSRLADARRDSLVETEVELASPTLTLPVGLKLEMTRKEIKAAINNLDPERLRSIRNLNKPHLPVPAKKVYKDDFGNPVKRPYTRRPKPEDPDYDEYLEDLPPEKRDAYAAQFRKKRTPEEQAKYDTYLNNLEVSIANPLPSASRAPEAQSASVSSEEIQPRSAKLGTQSEEDSNPKDIRNTDAPRRGLSVHRQMPSTV